MKISHVVIWVVAFISSCGARKNTPIGDVPAGPTYQGQSGLTWMDLTSTGQLTYAASMQYKVCELGTWQGQNWRNPGLFDVRLDAQDLKFIAGIGSFLAYGQNIDYSSNVYECSNLLQCSLVNDKISGLECVTGGATIPAKIKVEVGNNTFIAISPFTHTSVEAADVCRGSRLPPSSVLVEAMKQGLYEKGKDLWGLSPGAYRTSVKTIAVDIYGTVTNVLATDALRVICETD